MNRVDYDYKVSEKVMLINISAYKYETPFKGVYKIVQCRTNVTVTLKMGDTINRLSIWMINPYKSKHTPWINKVYLKFIP